jgi:hypothetical protein
MRKRNPIFLFIMLIWLLWVCLVLFLKFQEVDKTEIAVKEGTAIAAQCVESRSVKGVKFRVVYSSDEVVDDYISLPLGFSCDADFIERFDNNPLKISYYENRYLGFDIGGFTVREVDESIEEINDKGAVLAFTLFMALVITFSLFMYGRNRAPGPGSN